MLKRLLSRGHPGDAASLPDDLWKRTWDAVAFVQRFGHEDQARLRQLCGRFLSDKSMTGAGGLQLSGQIQLSIALQACVPILELGLDWYRGWNGIVVYPADFLVARRTEDEHGLVHEFDDQLSGESWPGGPVVLAWDPDVASNGGHAFNVVIHEFAHKLDQLAEPAGGRPPFDRRLHPGLDPQAWDDAREDAFERLNAAVELAEASIPADVDPESAEAAKYFANLPLDPYAAEDPAEFFAVSSEAFFTSPQALSDAFVRWYSMLAAFYRQDPLAV
jgi:MtfA peptidase